MAVIVLVARDVAVVARVVHRRGQEAVDEQRAGVLVDLVLDRVLNHLIGAVMTPLAMTE